MKNERPYLWGLRASLLAVFTVEKLATNDVRWEVFFLLQVEKLAKFLARFAQDNGEQSSRCGGGYATGITVVLCWTKRRTRSSMRKNLIQEQPEQETN